VKFFIRIYLDFLPGVCLEHMNYPAVPELKNAPIKGAERGAGHGKILKTITGSI